MYFKAFSFRVNKTVLTLSQATNFRLFQTERVCRRQFQIPQKWQKALQTGRKHCGKRSNCSLQAISPFPTVFSKELCFRHIKTRACLGKGHGFTLIHFTGIFSRSSVSPIPQIFDFKIPNIYRIEIQDWYINFSSQRG